MNKVKSYKEVPLGEAILNANSWDDGDVLLLCFDEIWDVNCQSLIATVDHYLKEDPEVILNQKKFEYVFLKSQIIEILGNSESQLDRDLSQEEALKAFLFYFDNDAFFDWS